MNKSLVEAFVAAMAAFWMTACGGGDGGGDGPSAQCTEECTADGDCSVGGNDVGFTCQDGRCKQCMQDSECLVKSSGWVTDCTDNAGCPNQACIDIGGGAGKCAITPSDALKCDSFSMKELMMPALDGSGDVTVCGNPDTKCTRGLCLATSTTNAKCPDTPCPANSECVDGTCRCSNDDACMGFGKCQASGVCGCADVADCTANKVFGGTTQVCSDKL